MNVGDMILWAAGLSLLAALYSYTRRRDGESGIATAGRFMYAHAILLTVASGWLLWLFLGSQFQCGYVAHNSSRDLPLFYKISAFWAGQEGTFLLWAWITAVLALVVVHNRGPLLRGTMITLILTQSFLMLLLYLRSPFLPVEGGIVPADGQGLNPLLKDPWMVIHPPVVFVGYAGFAIPFAYTVAALARREWTTLAASIFPWVVFAVTTLGAGLFIGGFWAYKVLGWGGYWGWDPVENASLVPWLAGLALVHALVLFRVRGQLARTSMALSVISYLLVVYGTFLTRSGVLSDFSVHSFADAGINVYLTTYLILVTVTSLGLLVRRAKRVIAPPITRSLSSRESGIVLSILLLCLTGAFVLIGTSSPILTGLTGKPANVTTDYYNTMALPLGALIAFALGLSPFLVFERTPWRDLWRRITLPLIGAAAATGALFIATSIRPTHALFVFGAALALLSNVAAMIRFSHGRPLRMAGHLTHAGFAVLLLGIIASSGYSAEQRLTMPVGQSAKAYGFDIAYRGAHGGGRDEEGYLDLVVSDGTHQYNARPKLYVSDYTQQIMRTPYIRKNLVYDLYIAPLDHEQASSDANAVTLTKGETAPYAGWDLTFLRYDIGEHTNAGAMRVGTVVEARRGRDTIQFVPAVDSDRKGQHPVPTRLPGTDLVFSMTGMSVEQKQIKLSVDGPDGAPGETGDQVILSVSKKPLTSFVWLGCVILTAGSGLSFWRRRRDALLIE
ncbi:MAG: heme lyase CcmF/NrfE family subunit [candidate division Zixibacteria bacterium]|nr:heme lyase CcmF/NrfE family subunit [candidate division Zixibacteria bacterium]